MCQVWQHSYYNIERSNDILLSFAQIYNPLPGFKLWYSEIINMIYVLVKNCNFSEYGILHLLPFYEVWSILEKYKEEIEEQNKRQEEENKKMEAQMADMRHSMNTNMNTNKIANTMAQPKMPQLPSFK